jgi:hypothetical protein
VLALKPRVYDETIKQFGLVWATNKLAMEPDARSPDLGCPARSGLVNTTHATSTSDDRAATIRDALLWGAAFVPFIALALLPRRSQLNRLRGDISSLSRQSSKQSKSVLEALALLRQGQEDSLVELRQRLASNTTLVAKLESSSSDMFDVQEKRMQEITEAINAVVQSQEERDDENVAVSHEAIAALEEARNHLISSRRYACLL